MMEARTKRKKVVNKLSWTNQLVLTVCAYYRQVTILVMVLDAEYTLETV